MKKDDYKRVIDKLEPDSGLEKRFAEKLKNKPKKVNNRIAAAIAASLIIFTAIAVLSPKLVKINQPADKGVKHSQTAGITIAIPKIELPKGSNSKADMIGLIVYKGKVYTQCDTRITPEAAKGVLGEKIGRTKGNIDEWSKQDDYAKEFASSIGEMDVYTVEGYDSSFRIMTYQDFNGEIFSEFYECLNGIEVRNGEDVFGKMNIVGNIQTVAWQTYNNWNNSKEEFIEVAADNTINEFLQALYKAVPIEQEKLQQKAIFDGGEETQKFLILKLKDNSVIRLRLFKGDYVFYSSSHVFFKVDSNIFAKLWDALK